MYRDNKIDHTVYDRSKVGRQLHLLVEAINLILLFLSFDRFQLFFFITIVESYYSPVYSPKVRGFSCVSGSGWDYYRLAIDFTV